MCVIYILSGSGKTTEFSEKIKKLLTDDLKGKNNIVFIHTTFR